jgi:hypothetical protein
MWFAGVAHLSARRGCVCVGSAAARRGAIRSGADRCATGAGDCGRDNGADGLGERRAQLVRGERPLGERRLQRVEIEEPTTSPAQRADADAIDRVAVVGVRKRIADQCQITSRRTMRGVDVALAPARRVPQVFPTRQIEGPATPSNPI